MLTITSGISFAQDSTETRRNIALDTATDRIVEVTKMVSDAFGYLKTQVFWQGSPD